MTTFVCNLAAGVTYTMAAVLLFTKARMKSVLYFFPTNPVKVLIGAFAALGTIYFLRIILFYGGYQILSDSVQEDFFLRIAFTCLPTFCIAFTSISSGIRRRFLVKTHLLVFAILFVLISLIGVWYSGRLSFLGLFSGMSHTLCISFIFLGCMLSVILEKRLSVPGKKSPGPLRSYKFFLVSLWVFSLMSYVCVVLDVFLPAKLFFLGNIPIHLLFLDIILMKDTDLLYGGKWVQETQIAHSKVWQDLEEANKKVSGLYKEIYERIKAYLETEQCYRNPSISREEVAAAIGTNVTYVTRALNEYGGMNFKQFINSYRVQYAQEYYKRNPEARLIELCNESGFQSLTALNLAFRINIGMTPGEWCRMQTKFENVTKNKTWQ
ncbi:MAG TPA: helix-turn-helix domain-containing protein [Bacteroidales bacterium]|nr:helix-turn-helix domain-containing protein [Bacteroidales bacterium]HRW94708.1 helix-turn-helix domain-containing protein [Bacteroidales bacterium]